MNNTRNLDCLWFPPKNAVHVKCLCPRETATSSNGNSHAKAAGGDITPEKNLCFFIKAAYGLLWKISTLAKFLLISNWSTATLLTYLSTSSQIDVKQCGAEREGGSRAGTFVPPLRVCACSPPSSRFLTLWPAAPFLPMVKAGLKFSFQKLIHPHVFLFVYKAVRPTERRHRLCSATCRLRKTKRTIFEKCAKLRPRSDPFFSPPHARRPIRRRKDVGLTELCCPREQLLFME